MKVGDRNSHENLQAEVERLRTELTRRERDTKNQLRISLKWITDSGDVDHGFR